ncbi:hypothetical protein ASG37_14655 [Sphingomonas sp. Leaf407]|uniref:hypothetical protein n=1 Tax=unclassified Sphingomonas TaxID=196159 RepID=UPI0006FA1548|nr:MULTISPECIES: hypothetical protein [unclassified Sphingomonas]KQN35577.1 hypothetical protein ASE97_13910 [Sphingomonas sp. Leaf42]KQT26444.1 hypothetical protein ASG37_14655 [Sphingomonas sp. Leaf407]
MRYLQAVAVVAAMVAVPVVAQSADDFAAKVINAPLPASLSVYGLGSPPPVVRVKGVDGGKAMRVVIPAADKDPWKISLSSSTTQPVNKGDRLVLAFHARATGMAAGTKARIANASVQLAKAPYTGLFGQPVEVGDQFEFLQVAGKADRDYAAGELSASLQLATGKQTFEFGPLFIINLDRK